MIHFKAIILKMLVIAILITPYATWGNEYSTEQSERERLKAIDEINQKYENKTKRTLRALSVFPTSHPITAAYGSFTSYNATFNVYLWGESNKGWMEIVPIKGEPFACSSSYTILQSGIQINSIKLVDQSGNSLCSSLYIPIIVELTTYSFSTLTIDFTKPFTLIYDFVTSTKLEVPALLSSDVQQPTIPDEYTRGYNEGYIEGVASVTIPTCIQKYTQADLDAKYKEGVASVKIPTCIQKYTQADLDAAINGCVTNPSSCGITTNCEEPICSQVITYAKPSSVDCWIMFTTSCGIPAGWETTNEEPTDLCGVANSGDGCAILESNINITMPCIDVFGTTLPIKLERFNNKTDPFGYYWKLNLQ